MSGTYTGSNVTISSNSPADFVIYIYGSGKLVGAASYVRDLNTGQNIVYARSGIQYPERHILNGTSCDSAIAILESGTSGDAATISNGDLLQWEHNGSWISTMITKVDP